jgi:hypothetical protein
MNLELHVLDIGHAKAVAQTNHEIYRILTVEGELYLPPEKSVGLFFIRDIMTGKKKVRLRYPLLNDRHY